MTIYNAFNSNIKLSNRNTSTRKHHGLLKVLYSFRDYSVQQSMWAERWASVAENYLSGSLNWYYFG